MTWYFAPRHPTFGARLAAFVVLAHDPSVPAVAVDWWDISRPYYLSVVDALTELTAGRRSAGDLARLAEAPADRDRERTLAAALDRLLAGLPEERAHLEALVAAAEAHILIDHHRGPRAGRPVSDAGLTDVLAWAGPRPGRTGPPSALVVIPFRDRVGGARARNLFACLASLRDQRSRAGDVTVTLVESDEEPRWRDTVAPFVDHYLFAPHSGHFNKSWTVNVGVMQTPVQADLVCVLDSDVLVDDRFVERNLARMERGTEPAAFLPYRSMFCLDEPSSHAAIRARCEDGRPDVSTDEIRALVLREPPGACIWVRADVFHRIGGFDERYQGWGGEDDDVVARLRRAGRVERFEDPLIHLSHPRPAMHDDGRPFNAHIEPLSWSAVHGFGDLRGPAAAVR